MIFSVVILGLVGLSFQVARRATRSTDDALVLGMLLSSVDRAATTAFDSLPGLAGCDTTVSGPVRVVGCIGVTSVSQRVRSVTVVVSTTVPGSRPDTVVVRRGNDRRPIPLRGQ